MKARELRHAAWNKLDKSWFTVVVGQIVQAIAAVMLLPTIIGPLVIGGVFAFGRATMLLRCHWNGKADLNDLFSGFRFCLGNSIVARLTIWGRTLLWSLLLLIPGIVKAHSYAMTFHILAQDPKLEVSEAIRRSEYMMNGKKWSLFCLNCSFIGWFLLIPLSLGIAGWWVIPYYEAARTELFCALQEQMTRDGYYTEKEAAL